MTVSKRWFLGGVSVACLLAICGMWDWAIFAVVFAAFATLGQTKLDARKHG